MKPKGAYFGKEQFWNPGILFSYMLHISMYLYRSRCVKFKRLFCTQIKLKFHFSMTFLKFLCMVRIELLQTNFQNAIPFVPPTVIWVFSYSTSLPVLNIDDFHFLLLLLFPSCSKTSIRGRQSYCMNLHVITNDVGHQLHLLSTCRFRTFA